MDRKAFNKILLNLILVFINILMIVWYVSVDINESNLLQMSLVWLFVLGFQILISPKSSIGLIGIITMFISLYSVSAFIAASLGFMYFEIPQYIIFEVTSKSLVVIIVCHLTLLLLKMMLKFPDVSFIEREFINIIFNLPYGKLKMMLALLGIMGLYFWYRIIFVIGIKALLENPRVYATILFEQVGFYHQIVMIPLSIILITYVINKQIEYGKKFIILNIVLFAWLPLLLVGARKEIYICIIAVFLFSGISRMKKMVLGVFAVLLLLLLPLLREGWVGFDNLIMSFHEFILPQYSHFIFEVLGSEAKRNIVETSGYQAGFWSLLPGMLRPKEYIPLGLSTFNLGLTNVGIAAHPIGEAVLNFNENGYVFFGLIYVVINTIVFMISKRSPLAAVIFFSYLSLLGRTDLWVTIFFGIYTYVFIRMFLMKVQKTNKM